MIVINQHNNDHNTGHVNVYLSLPIYRFTSHRKCGEVLGFMSIPVAIDLRLSRQEMETIVSKLHKHEYKKHLGGSTQGTIHPRATTLTAALQAVVTLIASGSCCFFVSFFIKLYSSYRQ